MSSSIRPQTLCQQQQRVIVGIDPQPRLLAVHVRCKNFNGELNTFDWFKHYLQKKSRFDNAQAWQEYIYHECYTILKQVKLNVSIKLKSPPTLVVIEQQKGRVNSIVEQSLLVSCKVLDLPCLILHPTTWKKRANVPCMHDHKRNKQVVEEMVMPYLYRYRNSNVKEDRDHDMCDAFKISEAGENSFLSLSKPTTTTEENARKSQSTS